MRSARQVLSIATVGMAGVAVVASAALVGSTRLMHGATETLADAMTNVRAAGEIDTALLLANREAFLLALTGDGMHRRERDEAVGNLRRWLAEARLHVGDAEERRRLERTEQTTAAFLAEVLNEPAAHRSPAARYQAVNPLLVAAHEATEALIATNLAQADEARARVARWDALADALGFAAMAVVLLATAGVLVLLRRGLFRPLLALRDALARYGAGDRTARASGGGPHEARQIASVFNTIADRLEQQREEQIAFAAGVAHDLRNPLSALKASAWLPAAGVEALPAPQLQRRFELVRRQVDRLDALVDDLLEVSRMDAGRLELRPAPHDLRTLAAEAVELHACVSPSHRLELDADAPVPLVCDGGRVARVLNNLVGNAIKHSPDGGVVRVRVRAGAGEALLEVQDQGPGIAPEDAERIFEPFRRGGRPGRRAPGLGLGLFVARRLVEAHGGRIEVAPAPGGGSLFRVALPLPKVHAPARRESSAQPLLDPRPLPV